MEDETSSRTSSQMLNINDDNSIASLLYCDEDPLVSTTPPPPFPPPPQQASVLATVDGDVEEEDHLKELLVDHMARQRFYAPTCRGGYLEHLLPRRRTPPQQQGSAEAIIVPAGSSVSGARSTGVHYIIYAFGRLGLTVATVFNAVNYLDRFLSINCHLWWEAWMVELVSVACLSIACKLDEVNIPSLHDLQMEEVMRHWFLPATVRDMELTLLKALQWRLACVTPYSFLHLLLPLLHTTAADAASRCTRLLIRSLAEPWFIQFDSSIVASSALRCVLQLEEDHHSRRHHHHHQTALGYITSRLIPPDCPATAMQDEADDADECFRMMKTLYDDATSCCSSESDSDWNWNWNWNTHHHHQLQLYSSDDERLRMSPGVSSVIRRRPLQLQTASGGGGSGSGSRLLLNSSSRAAVSRRRLFASSASASSAPQGNTTQLQLQDDDDTTHVRDEDISHTSTNITDQINC